MLFGFLMDYFKEEIAFAQLTQLIFAKVSFFKVIDIYHELDLIEAWFVGNSSPAGATTSRANTQTAPQYVPPQGGMVSDPARGSAPGQPRTADEFTSDEFPRIVRTRLRG